MADSEKSEVCCPLCSKVNLNPSVENGRIFCCHCKMWFDYGPVLSRETILGEPLPPSLSNTPYIVGSLIMIAGLIMLLVGYNFNTANGDSENFGLLNERLILVMIALAISLAGLLIILFATIRPRP